MKKQHPKPKAVPVKVNDGEEFAPFEALAKDDKETLTARLAELDRHIAQCQAERLALVKDIDAIIEEEEAKFDPHANQKAIMAAIESDHRNRARQHQAYQELVADNPDIAFKKPLAPVDAVLRNRKRPLRNVNIPVK